MKKKIAPAPTAVAKISHTYSWEGKTLTQEEMLKVTEKCRKNGDVLRFVVSQRKDLPDGSLMDKTAPLYPVLSIEAQAAETLKKRKSEGHRFDGKPALHPEANHFNAK